MEKRIKENLELAIDAYNEKRKIYDIEAAKFLNELFTEDVWKMIDVLLDGRRYVNLYDIPYGEYLRFYDDKMITISRGDYCYSKFRIDRYIQKENSYDSCTINSLTECVKHYNEQVKYLNYVKEHAEDIIETITQKYKDLTETQADAIDKVLADLDADFEPTKHIKVTVEWI